MQKRVNIASLRLLSLEGPTCKADPWLTSRNLKFNYSLTDKTGLLYLDCINNVIYGEHQLSFWESGILQLLVSGHLCDQSPIKTMDAESLIGFPGHKYCTYITAYFTIEERRTVGMFTHGREKAQDNCTRISSRLHLFPLPILLCFLLL